MVELSTIYHDASKGKRVLFGEKLYEASIELSLVER
jgi:hypothetical protein